MSYKERTIIMAKIDYDNLTKQIVEYVGGVENIKTITHCVTRLRLYLNDRNKAEDEKIKNLPGVLDRKSVV